MYVPDDLPVPAVSGQVAEQLVIELDELEHADSSRRADAHGQSALVEVPWGAQEPRAESTVAPAGVELTEQQECAVERRRGGLLLAAGAGSGKTAVLVERFVRAVLVDGIAPARILAITFTDRAAGELAQRLRQRFLDLGEREHARDVEAAIVGTFHTFCARLLRTHALAAGVPPEFSVLNEAQASEIRAAAFQDALTAVAASEPHAAVELLAAYGSARLRDIIFSAYSELRSRGAEDPRLPVPRGDSRTGGVARESAQQPADAIDAASALAAVDGLLAAFGARYAALKQARGALDFDDLELRARGALEQHSPIRDSWRERFELLMVDELQDVNHRQLALLGLLERENLFTVGDELQSIYGFRHADVGLFRRRCDVLARSGATFELTHNFRAREELVDAVNALFAPRFGERYRPLVAARTHSRADRADPALELLLTDRDWEQHEAGGAEASRAVDGPAWRLAEAQLVAQRVADLIAEKRARPRDVAVLLRATTGIEAYARALEEHGVATLAAVGGFWGDAQVGDLLAYLRAVANPRDELALYGVLASPLAGLSRDALALLARAGGEQGGAWGAARALAVQRGALAERDRERLQSFCELLARERVQSSWRGIAGTLRHVLEATGYEQGLLAMRSPERRIANVRKLLRLADHYGRTEGADLRGFLDHAAHAAQALGRAEPHAPVADEELEAVRLMTIHAAKGLEFPVVCVPELGARPNVRTPHLLVDGERVGLRLLRPGVPEATPAFDFESLAQERRQAQEQEEERILYVALTRPRERLLLSGVMSFRRWPPGRAGCAPIEWVAPSLVPEIERRVAGVIGADAAAEPAWVADGPGGYVRCWLNAPPTIGRVLREGALRPLARALTTSCAPDGAVASATGSAPRAAGHGRSPAPEAAAEVPPRAIPDSLSYSALTKLERCGYRYFLEDVLGIPQAPAGAAPTDVANGRARERGMVLHRLLERFDFRGDGETRVADVAALARELATPLRTRECNEIAALLGRIRGTPIAHRLSARGVSREQPFTFALQGAEPVLTGVIDALLRERGGRLLVVDYKSDRVTGEQDLEELVREEYGLQRLIYALAAVRDGAREVEVVHWFLTRPHEPVSARFAAARRGALEDELRGRLTALEGSGYAVSERPNRRLCAGCPGRGTLCSWSTEETLAEPR
jgi:ATP-dependent exoDNAse (exonuclease V) beta subunit